MHIGIDTSCYTTSVAAVSGSKIVFDKRIMLDVPDGARGLRQSDAVFLHTRNLAEIFSQIDVSQCTAVGVSSKPRDVEGSYMPVFLPGVAAARAVSSARGCPLYEFSHQQGHIMAGLYSANVPHWRDVPFLSLHISGGTTELLYTDCGQTRIVGKTLDIAAGQLIDRVGVALGLGFPCGKALEALADGKTEDIRLPVSVKGCDVNFSGAETKAQSQSTSPENLAAAVLGCVAESLYRMIGNAVNRFGTDRVLIVGGVAANKQIRQRIGGMAVFASPELSTDNAVGTALLAAERNG